MRRSLRSLQGRKVLVHGDLVCDEYVHTRIERTSREAPVLILRWTGQEYRAGGAANSIRNVAALGGRPRPVGILGKDEAGGELRRIFRKDRLATSGLVTWPGYPTPRKSRILAGLTYRSQQQVVRVDTLEDLKGGRKLEGSIRAALRNGLRGAEGVLVSDYGIGAVRPGLVRELFAEADRRGIPTVLDSRYRLQELPGAAVVTPNEAEAEAVLGGPLPEEDRALARAGEELPERLGARAVLLTRGSRGMFLFEQGEAPLPIPAFGTDEVTDVTGAGDTVAATLALALAAGVPLPIAAGLANVAAGLVVLKLGTAIVGREELDGALKRLK